MADAEDATAVAEPQEDMQLDGDEEAELAKLEAQLYGEEGGDDGDDAGASEDPGSGAGDAQGAGDASVPMTKSQMKRKARLERKIAKRAALKVREKEQRAAKREEAQARKAAELAAMTEEEKATMREERAARLAAFKEQERLVKERMKQSLEAGPRVIIDLDWEDKMTEADTRHLMQQLHFSYAANKHVEKPVHMMLTSFKGGIAATATKMISGIDNWHVTRTEQHYSELFAAPEQRQQLVYLTADSEVELEELDPAKVYIIGGMVDHNRYKGLCEGSARAAGIATARLPISKHVQLASRAVLTVNHVFQILAEWYNRRDWAAVLDAVLPMRKRAEYQQQQGAGGRGGRGGGGGGRGGGGRGGGGRGGEGGKGRGRGGQQEAQQEEGAKPAEAPAPAEPAVEAAAQPQQAAPAAAPVEEGAGAEAAASAEGSGAAEAEGRGTKRKAEDEAGAVEAGAQ
ncbi:hypothetical protein HYH03_009274 [Edaphochlamys debaryana]|uniref:tRNA (guanine(9)-N(1))-methyltransferase n=1 Tax=Edaphochlamys debaryana TaxID=47281 RepID=A0A835Y0D6_9CHLO|nr:hypothetical protein HYH03_009274 [Edaphochlamys debaryana]|eukprot:KAG2492323.1 hypothetical protein HYH03_009274 [Edaphochlamys debaryana]